VLLYVSLDISAPVQNPRAEPNVRAAAPFRALAIERA
jgi:hypothetical protein